MIPDPTAEIKSIRHRLGAERNYDLDRIVEDTVRRQSESGRTYIRLPKRDPRATNRGMVAVKAGRLENQSPPPRER